jgi:ribonuclease HI
VAPIVYIGGACVDKSPTYPRVILIILENAKLIFIVQNLKAGYGVFWGYGKNSDNLCERLPSNERQKDHRALYTAVLKAVNQGIIKGFPKMIIRTDSKCATKSLTIWLVFK